MSRRVFLWGFLVGLTLAVVAVMGYWVVSARMMAGPRGIAPETVADYLHDVIEANRTIYTKNAEHASAARLIPDRHRPAGY